jgi:DNA-binding NtrC family response regulator
MSKRYLAFVGSGKCLAELNRELTRDSAEIVDHENAIEQIAFYGPSCFSLGLVDVSDTSTAGLQRLSSKLELCRSHEIRCDWVAMVHPDDLGKTTTRQWLRRECIDFWPHPFHRLREHLAQFLVEDHVTPAVDPVKTTLNLIGSSPGMLHMRQLIARFGKVNSPVLIIGETGSGKELIARNIHLASPRAQNKFLALNCGAMSPHLIQSELFGHEKGSFTGAIQRKIGIIEAAQGGTLLLDEIGDLPIEAQVNFLRFLQEGSIKRVGGTQEIAVDIRIVAATHVNLDQAVSQGKFREDLLYRLNVLRLDVPPLRARASDVLLLADRILQNIRKSRHVAAHGFDPDAIRSLLTHNWPGNVRELANRIQRASVMCDRGLIAPHELGFNAAVKSAAAPDLEKARRQAAVMAIEEALMSQNYNFSKAAKALGVSRVTLYRLASKYATELSPLAMREMPSAMPPRSDYAPLQ